MAELEKLLAEILTVRDSPAVRALILDCYLHAQACGEASGLVWGRMLMDGVKRYQQHEAKMKASPFKK